MLCTALVLASHAGSAGAAARQNTPPRTTPQKLWKQYQLDPKGSGSPERSSRATGAGRAQSASPRVHSGTPWMALLWIACIVVALAWALSFALLIWRPQSSRDDGRRALGADNLTEGLIEAVRRARRTASRQIEQSFVGRARKSH